MSQGSSSRQGSMPPRGMPGWPGVAPPEAHALTSEEFEQRAADGELSAPTIELACDEQIRQFAKETFENIKLKADGDVGRLRAERYLKYAHPEVKVLGKSMKAAEEVEGIKKKHNAARDAVEGIMASKDALERELRDLEAQGSDEAAYAIDTLKKKLRSNQDHVENMRRKLEAIENGDMADAYRSWREATEAYENWLQDNGVKRIEQDLEAANAEAAAAGLQSGQNFEKRCRNVLIDWLSDKSKTSIAASDVKGGADCLMLLANVTFPGVRLKSKATGEFDLMLVRVVEAAELGLEPQALKELGKARQQQAKNGKPSTSTQLVYVTPDAEAHDDATEVLPVEVVAVVECKNGAKQILSHIISMERGLSFFSTSSRITTDGPEAAQSRPGGRADLPTFSSGVVQLKDGGPSLLFTPESFRCFRPENGFAEADDGHRPRCCLSRLFYMTEKGRLGPINSISELVFEKMMKEEAFDTEGNVLRVPAGMAKLIAKRQEDEKNIALRGSRMICRLVQHRNLWMLPSADDDSCE